MFKLLPLLLLASPQAAEPALPPTAHIAIIGASVSEGFGLSLELESACNLTPFVDAALKIPHDETLNLGSGMMFSGTLRRGTQQLERALASKPTLIIAADFLFWFGYGFGGTLDSRMQSLGHGLALLEQVECPILIGDLPNMRAALAGTSPLTGGGPIISAAQVPSAEHLEQLNACIMAWAKDRENVHIFRMSRFVNELLSPKPFEIRGNKLGPEMKSAVMQADLLHPTVKGTAIFCVLLFDQLVRDGVLQADEVEWNAAILEAAVWEATAPRREKIKSRRARRDERKRKLEQQSREKDKKKQLETQGV
jgi:hypothetical protein